MEDMFKFFTASDGTEIRYIDMGEGPALIFGHGFGGNAAAHLPLFQNLGKDFRCISWDQRGYGGTPANGDIGIPQSARDLKELIEHLNLSDVTILGYSMGGAVVFSYVQQFGVEHLGKIVIQDMSPKVLNDDTWNLGAYQGWYKKEDCERDTELMKKDYKCFQVRLTIDGYKKMTPEQPRSFEYKPEMMDQLLAVTGGNQAIVDLLLNIPPEQEKSNAIYWNSAVYADYRDTLEKMTVPVALMYADPGSFYDPRVAEYMAEHIPNAVKYPYYDCSHMFRVEKQDKFFDDLRDFMNNH